MRLPNTGDRFLGSRFRPIPVDQTGNRSSTKDIIATWATRLRHRPAPPRPCGRAGRTSTTKPAEGFASHVSMPPPESTKPVLPSAMTAAHAALAVDDGTEDPRPEPRGPRCREPRNARPSRTRRWPHRRGPGCRDRGCPGTRHGRRVHGGFFARSSPSPAQNRQTGSPLPRQTLDGTRQAVSTFLPTLIRPAYRITTLSGPISELPFSSHFRSRLTGENTSSIDAPAQIGNPFLAQQRRTARAWSSGFETRTWAHLLLMAPQLGGNAFLDAPVEAQRIAEQQARRGAFPAIRRMILAPNTRPHPGRSVWMELVSGIFRVPRHLLGGTGEGKAGHGRMNHVITVQAPPPGCGCARPDRYGQGTLPARNPISLRSPRSGG